MTMTMTIQMTTSNLNFFIDYNIKEMSDETQPTVENIVINIASLETGTDVGDVLLWENTWDAKLLSSYNYPVNVINNSENAFATPNITVDTLNSNVTATADLIAYANIEFDEVADLNIDNSLLSLSTGNPGNTLDIGIYGKYINAGTHYAGLFRDASDSGKWKLFTTDVPPNLTISDFSLADLSLGNLSASVVSASTLAGAISTASQPSITTLAGLTTINTGLTGVLKTTSGLLSTATTDDLSQGVSNFYFDTQRTRDSFSAENGLDYTNGVLSMVSGYAATFASLTLSNLTASRLVASDSSKILASTNLSSWIAGTPNQITSLTNGVGGVTLSLPQSIHTMATPQFSSLGLGTTASTAGTIRLAGSSSGNITTSAGSEPTSYTLTLPSSAGTNTFRLATDGSGNASWNYPVYIGHQVYAYRRVSHQNGDPSTSNTWVTRILDTKLSGNLDGVHTSLASNQVTIQPGTYMLLAHGACFQGLNHIIRIYNQTDSSVVSEGTIEMAGTTFPTSRSWVMAYINISSAKVFTVDHQTSISANFGPTTAGSMTNTTDNYCHFQISKIT